MTKKGNPTGVDRGARDVEGSEEGRPDREQDDRNELVARGSMIR